MECDGGVQPAGAHCLGIGERTEDHCGEHEQRNPHHDGDQPVGDRRPHTSLQHRLSHASQLARDDVAEDELLADAVDHEDEQRQCVPAFVGSIQDLCDRSRKCGDAGDNQGAEKKDNPKCGA